jgi:hypothetical protein
MEEGSLTYRKEAIEDDSKIMPPIANREKNKSPFRAIRIAEKTFGGSSA